MSTTAPTSGTKMDTGEDIGAMATLRLGMKYSPELREGLGLTLFFAVVASCGQIVVPITVQQTLDRGLNGPGGPRLDYVVWMGVLAAFAMMTGTVQLSRALADRELADEVLEEGIKNALVLFGATQHSQ